MYSTWRNQPLGDYRTFNQKRAGYCFDDLGTEETKSHFGNKINVMAEIILNRYDNKTAMGWEFTHVTTNLSADEIEQYYGSRVRSRFREMFNAITLNGNDRRK
jgi:DNA replication protein DnaC